MDYDLVARALEAFGLRARGGFYPKAADAVPPLSDGALVGTVVLAGAVGGSLWSSFAPSPERSDGQPHALDRWSRRVLTCLAGELGAEAVFPFDGPPHHPFQRWAQRAEPVSPSPLGLLIHPDYGLWHSWRGALLFTEHLSLPPRKYRESPCSSCAERPCLQTCPVGAFSAAGYNASACADHLSANPGPCFAAACLARASCPVASHLRYGEEQSSFHISAFLAGRRP